MLGSDQDVEVVAMVTDGADAVGEAVAAQPDVALIEAVLSRMTGLEVVADLRTFAPGVRTVVRVADNSAGPALLAAGATAVWLRSAKPEQVAIDLGQFARVSHYPRRHPYERAAGPSYATAAISTATVQTC